MTVRKIEHIESAEELKKNIGKKEPMMISINGKGVIHKKTTLPDSTNPELILNGVLPGSNPQEFSYQVTESGSGQCFVSLIRNSSLNELLEELKKASPNVPRKNNGPKET